MAQAFITQLRLRVCLQSSKLPFGKFFDRVPLLTGNPGEPLKTAWEGPLCAFQSRHRGQVAQRCQSSRNRFFDNFLTRVFAMQFPHHEFASHPENRLMYYPSSEHLCSCTKCLRRKYSSYENAHLMQRQELETQRRLMYSSHHVSLPSPQMPAPFSQFLEARSYYPGAALTSMGTMPRYGYEQDVHQHGKSVGKKKKILHLYSVLLCM